MKLAIALPALAAALIWIGCGSTKFEKDAYPDSKPKYAIALDKEGRKHGPETWWHSNGVMKYQATNRAGTREGQFTAWYPSGTKWYQGYEFNGKPESTLTYWHPSGKMKSQALFRDGIQLERRDYDAQGDLIAPKPSALAEASLSMAAEQESAEAAERLRKTSLNMWAMRVRQTVEGYWVLPKQFEKQRPYRAVANIKVGRDGRILGVSWREKSPSSSFNTLAQNTFKRIKRLPAFPPQIKDESLDLQYEFISLGKTLPRTRLEARETPADNPGPAE